MIGLYVHVPFCAHKCDYCDFYSIADRLDLVASYIDAIIAESSRYKGLLFDTLYVGGGTPSILGAQNLGSLLSRLKAGLNIREFIEATIEVNPDSASRELFENAMNAGVTRVSVGVQSLSDQELKKVSRIHTAKQALAAIRMAEVAGFQRISADVIIGLPGQTRQTLLNTLDTLVSHAVGHVSLYCLSLEHDTPLAVHPPNDLPSDDEQVDLFNQARDFLRGNGFVHYEISNFASSGHECAHNLNYWRGGEYVGLGTAAASHLQGKRFKNRSDLLAYIRNPCGVVEDIEELPTEEKMAEEAMLRLRLLSEGLTAGDLMHKFGSAHAIKLIRRLNVLVTQDRLLYDGTTYRLAPSAVLTSNAVFSQVLRD